MSELMISAKPEFAGVILSGQKRFEFRKTRCCRDVSRMLLYSSSSVHVVVGEVEITGILEGPADKVWEQAKDAAEISRDRSTNRKYKQDTLREAVAIGLMKSVPLMPMETNMSLSAGEMYLVGRKKRKHMFFTTMKTSSMKIPCFTTSNDNGCLFVVVWQNVKIKK